MVIIYLESGCKILFVSEGFILYIIGILCDESDVFLKELYVYIICLENVYMY